MEQENAAEDKTTPIKASETEERIKRGIDALLDRIIRPLKTENAALKAETERQKANIERLLSLLCRIKNVKAD